MLEVEERMRQMKNDEQWLVGRRRVYLRWKHSSRIPDERGNCLYCCWYFSTRRKLHLRWMTRSLASFVLVHHSVGPLTRSTALGFPTLACSVNRRLHSFWSLSFELVEINENIITLWTQLTRLLAFVVITGNKPRNEEDGETTDVRRVNALIKWNQWNGYNG